MALQDRIALFQQLENKRGFPLIAYVTSMRPNCEGHIDTAIVSELLGQLEALPAGCQELDLLVGSYGGDGTVAWRIVSLIRERVERLNVLVPQAAFSAATLIALGANKIVMHPHGNLGPTDPQIMNRVKNVQFGSEDMAAFLKFARTEVGLTDQAPLLELFKKFCEEVGFVGIGVAARSAQLAQSMGEKLLRLHMKSESQMQKAKIISESLNTKYFHHGYAVSRSEAKEIGLPISDGDAETEGLMRKIWLDLEAEIQMREPFSPVAVLKNDPACAALFAPAAGGAPAIFTANFSRISAIMESVRKATRSIVEGSVSAMRMPDLNLKMNVVPHREGWIDTPLPAGNSVTGTVPAIGKKKTATTKK